jgi:hypothetical protein
MTEFSPAEWNRLLQESMTTIRELAASKGGEYSGDIDRLANFRRNAKESETTMEFVWRIYASKHWDALMQYEKDLRTGRDRPRSEPIDGRVDDLIVYLLLFKAMVQERKEEPIEPVKRTASTFGKVWDGRTDSYVDMLTPPATPAPLTPDDAEHL